MNKKQKDKQKKLFEYMVESLDNMKLTPFRKEFAKAVLRNAIEHAAMRMAGFELEKK